MSPIKSVALVFVAVVAGLLTPCAVAQENATPPGAQNGQTSLPYAEPRFRGDVGTTFKDSSPAKFPQRVKAPAGAPNVLLVLLDDAGFGQFSVAGGGVPSPNMEKLAKEGLFYNRFHTTALCSPSRAAILTGRNHHVAGTGIITELATGYDGYTGIIPKSTATVAEILRQNGYITAWIGKNHNTPIYETSPMGPFDHWPNGLGFDYFYGFMAGDTNQIRPYLYENQTPLGTPDTKGYFLSTDLADHTIKWLQMTQEVEPDKPWFLYLAPAATHSPHQAPQELIAKYLVRSDSTVPAGKHEFKMVFTYDGGKQYGKSGTIALFVDNQQVGSGKVDQTTPFKYSLSENQDVGIDTGTPVTYDYTEPFPFQGTLDQVVVDLNN